MTTLVAGTHVDTIPVSSLSIYDLVHLGVDEYGRLVEIELIYRNILLGGEPGSGKSVALNNSPVTCLSFRRAATSAPCIHGAPNSSKGVSVPRPTETPAFCNISRPG